MKLNEDQRNAIAVFYEEMFYPMLAFAQSILNDRMLAYEAVQDTFRIACAKIDNFLFSANPKGWLLNTLKYVIRNTIRTRANLKRIVISLSEANQNTISTDTYSIDVMYSDLSDDKNFLLLKRIAIDQLTLQEVSQELGISIEACKKRVQRAKEKLKTHFNKDG